MRNEGTRQGCMGCATVLILVLAVTIAFSVHYAPPMLRSVIQAYQRRVASTFTKADEPEETADTDRLGYAGERLSEDQQDVYLQILDGVEKSESTISVFEANPDDIDPAYKALMRDHPELFWLDGSCVYTYSKLGNVVSVEVGLNMKLEDVPNTKAQIEKAADEMMAGVSSDNTSAYDVARTAYERLIESTDYNVSAPQNQNIQSVFIGHTSVCAGYARAYQYLLQRFGIPCAYVEGTVTTTGEDHAWNLIKIGDAYAYVDPTWGDPTYAGDTAGIPLDSVIFDYFCLTTDEITRDHHMFANEGEWPVCNSTELDYYRTSGLFFDDYDETQIGESFQAQSQAHPGSAYFKFGSDEVYSQAIDALSAGTFARNQLMDIALSAGQDAIQYHYAPSDALRIVKLYW